MLKDREEINRLALDDATNAEAILLGRRSYEWFASKWPSRSGELADRLNALPKYVVSSTLTDPAWNNSVVMTGDVLNAVAQLRGERTGDILVLGSFQLVHMLIEHDLADELRLKVYPIVLGAGQRLFGETSEKKPMRLLESRSLGEGVAAMTYEAVRDA